MDLLQSLCSKHKKTKSGKKDELVALVTGLAIYNDLLVDGLKKLCKAKGMSCDGVKSVLVERLTSSAKVSNLCISALHHSIVRIHQPVTYSEFASTCLSNSSQVYNTVICRTRLLNQSHKRTQRRREVQKRLTKRL